MIGQLQVFGHGSSKWEAHEQVTNTTVMMNLPKSPSFKYIKLQGENMSEREREGTGKQGAILGEVGASNESYQFE